MPRGIPKSGVRNYTKKPGPKPKNAAALVTPLHLGPQFIETTETDEQIHAKLKERFTVMDEMVQCSILGEARSLIISGPGGLGKSFNVEAALEAKFGPQEDATDYVIVKGFMRATALYKTLYDNREEGSVIVFDDADAILRDVDTLTILKAVCDTTERRHVHWGAETKMVSEKDGELLPTRFEFKGTIIFISNIDFDLMIERGSSLAPHLEALISRSHYINLAMRSKRDYIIRIRQVVEQGLLDHMPKDQARQVITFIEKNVDHMRELSLRMAIKVATLRRNMPDKWERVARITCCK